MNPFAWIRRKAAEAVVLGVGDGLAVVAPGEDPPQDLDGLRQLAAERLGPKALAAAGAAAEADAPQARKRRA